MYTILDNYITHKTALIRRWFAKRSRFHVYFTPTYGSWLSLVERWFPELTMRIRRRALAAMEDREKAAAAWKSYLEADSSSAWAEDAPQPN